jgi:hypothetical protein
MVAVTYGRCLKSSDVSEISTDSQTTGRPPVRPPTTSPTSPTTVPATCAMEGPGNEMAHDDVWDDSALIRSWDEALDEYKVRAGCVWLAGRLMAHTCAGSHSRRRRPLLRIETDWRAQKYHSIHARGGKLEDLAEYVRHLQPNREGGPKTFRPVRTLISSFLAQAGLLSSRVVAGIHRMPSLKRATHSSSLSPSGRPLH